MEGGCGPVMAASRSIIAIRTCQVIHQDRRRIFHNALEIDFEPGVGLSSGVSANTDPQASLEWSDDGGNSWSTAQTRSIGSNGSYGTRCIWRRLGSSRERIYRVTISADVKKVIIAAHLDAYAGDS